MTLFLGTLFLGLALLTAQLMDLYVAHRALRKLMHKERVLRSGNLILSKLYLLPPSEFRLRWAERNLNRLSKLL